MRGTPAGRRSRCRRWGLPTCPSGRSRPARSGRTPAAPAPRDSARSTARAGSHRRDHPPAARRPLPNGHGRRGQHYFVPHAGMLPVECQHPYTWLGAKQGHSRFTPASMGCLPPLSASGIHNPRARFRGARVRWWMQSGSFATNRSSRENTGVSLRLFPRHPLRRATAYAFTFAGASPCMAHDSSVSSAVSF